MINHLKRLAIGFSFTFLCALLLCACGQGEESAPQGGSSSITGGYSATLVFPKDLPHLDNSAKALSGVDCVAAGIDKIEFNFILNDTQYGPYSFECELGRASITTAPAGSGVIVEVYADDADGNAVLQGSETIDIAAGRETIGGVIAMAYVLPEGSEPFPNSLGMTFVRIPKGTFTMGSPTTETGRDPDEIEHQVTLTKDFFMQTTEVTQGQWKAVMGEGNNPSDFAEYDDDYPVDSASWNDIQVFIERLNRQGQGIYALPTEAQWEYAARAERTTAFANGPMTAAVDGCYSDPNLVLMGWYCFNSQNNTTHPVGRLQPNDWGLRDMHGNVWEWVADSYDAYPSGDIVDPFVDVPGSNRVLRGGSWDYFAQDCRSASRRNDTPNRHFNRYGFRLVCLQFNR